MPAFRDKFRFSRFNKRVLVFVVAAFLIGFGSGVLEGDFNGKTPSDNFLAQLHPLRAQAGHYTFINPLLAYETPEATHEFAESKILKSKMAAYIDEAKSRGILEDASIYFRDLVQGRWVGVNEKMGYEPASLLKVVIMIAYYKEAEANQSLLDRKFLYTTSVNTSLSEIPFQTPSSLRVGETYTIDQLIDAMIIESDNGAKDILLQHIDENNLDAVYSDLGLQNPDRTSDYLISPKSYALFLRVLYNATYLSRSMSEKALGVLSRAIYADGLKAGLPQDVVLAQKFGEHISVGENGEPSDYDLSNCGIIYHPTKPYILCVMTRGKDITALPRVISDISRLVYEDVGS